MDRSRPGKTTRRRLLGGALGVAGAVVWPALARAAHVLRPWPADRQVPALELNDLDGKPWRLAALKGRPVLLNFWATWCEPSRTEMPSLERLAARHERAGLLVLAVNFKEPVPTIRRFLELQPSRLTVLLDADGDAASAWTPRVFPTTVLIDRGGMPRQSVLGDLDWSGSVARELVEPLLATPRSA